MRGIPVKDLDDPRLELFRNLRDRDLRALHGAYIVESPRVVRRFLQAVIEGGFEAEAILLEDVHARDLEPLLARLPSEVPIHIAPMETMIEISGYRFHAGALAIGRRPRFEPGLDQLIARTPTRGRLTILATDGVSNMDNVGAVIRDAAALGADGVLLGGGSSDPLLRKSIRVSMGRVFNVPWATCDDLPRALAELRTMADATIIALENLPDAETLPETTWPERVVIVAGNEGHGMQPQTIAACDSVIRIPGPDRLEDAEGPGGSDQLSLNVSVAVAITLYARNWSTPRTAPEGG